MAPRRVSLSSSSNRGSFPWNLNKKKSPWQMAWLVGVALGLATVVAAADQPSAPRTGAAQAPGSAQQSPGAASQEGELGPETLHVVVGHSMLIRTASRVKRILTGNPAVIESVLTSPQELVVTAKQPGGSSLMLWEETGRTACWMCSQIWMSTLCATHWTNHFRIVASKCNRRKTR